MISKTFSFWEIRVVSYYLTDKEKNYYISYMLVNFYLWVVVTFFSLSQTHKTATNLHFLLSPSRQWTISAFWNLKFHNIYICMHCHKFVTFFPLKKKNSLSRTLRMCLQIFTEQIINQKHVLNYIKNNSTALYLHLCHFHPPSLRS